MLFLVFKYLEKAMYKLTIHRFCQKSIYISSLMKFSQKGAGTRGRSISRPPRVFEEWEREYKSNGLLRFALKFLDHALNDG